MSCCCCPVHKGCSTCCDHLMLVSAVQMSYLEPTSLAVWFGKHFVCVYVCVHHPALPVLLHRYLDVCIPAAWGGKTKPTQRRPFIYPLHSHTRCPVMSFCSFGVVSSVCLVGFLGATPIMLCSTSIPSSFSVQRGYGQQTAE